MGQSMGGGAAPDFPLRKKKKDMGLKHWILPKWTLGIGNGYSESVTIPNELVTEIIPNNKDEPHNEEI